MNNKSYDYIINESRFKNINSIYFNLESEFFDNGYEDYEFIKNELIECIKYIVISKIGIIQFREWVEEKMFLEEASLEDKLDYFYKSLPDKIDDSTPENDINNLWWYISCPIDIGWKMEDGSYWFS